MDKKRVIYNGVSVAEGWPEQIEAAQEQPKVVISGKEYARIKYGSEKDAWGADQHPCGDCAAIKGQYHVPGCDIEQCPCCGGQAFHAIAIMKMDAVGQK